MKIFLKCIALLMMVFSLNWFLMLSGCTLFEKKGDDEMAELAQMAVKSHEDVTFDVKTTPQVK